MRIWYESNNPNGFVTGKRFSIDEPCITIMAAGMGGDSRNHWRLCWEEEDNGDDVAGETTARVLPGRKNKP